MDDLNLFIKVESDDEFQNEVGQSARSAVSRQTSRSRSRNGSPSPNKIAHLETPSATGRSSPMRTRSKDPIVDDKISILDPRRFTPTLHANLVAEILSLRRDLEVKTNVIETLEHDLSSARSEIEISANSVASAWRETKEAQQQLKQQEDYAVLEALSEERDQALETIVELKRQVERLTNLRRQAEVENDRDRQIAEREKTEWEVSKRSLDQRVHIAESRLRALLNEFALVNEAKEERIYEEGAEQCLATNRPTSRNSVRSVASANSDSIYSDRPGSRFSMISTDVASKHPRLADELELIEERSDLSDSNDIVYLQTGISAEVPLSPELATTAQETRNSDFESFLPTSVIFVSGKDSLNMNEESAKTIGKEEHLEVCDLRRENERLLHLVTYLEESIKLNKQEQEGIQIMMEGEIAAWRERTEEIERIGTEKEAISRRQRDVLQLEHQHQFELLESIAADTQYQLEILAAEKALLRKSTEMASNQKLDLWEEEDMSSNVEYVLQELIDEVLRDEDSLNQDLFCKKTLERESVSVTANPERQRIVSFLEGNSQSYPMEVEANQRRKRVSLTAPASSTPNLLPSTKTSTTSFSKTVSVGVQTSLSWEVDPKTDAACQTDSYLPNPPHQSTFTIPSITIHPPPISTDYHRRSCKDAYSQTQQPPKIRSSSVQTETIQIDQRIMAPKPINIPSKDTSQGESSPPILPQKSSKRPPRTLLMRLHTAPSSVGTDVITRREYGPLLQQHPPGRISPSLPKVSPNGVLRPPRTTSLFHFDAPSDEDDDDGDIELPEEEFKTVLSAPKPPKPRSSEISSNQVGRGKPTRRQTSVRKNPPILRPFQTERLLNKISNGPIDDVKLPGGPPFPVPIRHSSRKLPPSMTSSRASSPTPMFSRDGGIRRTRDSLRKSRSGLALQIEGISRNRSPPPLSTSSLGPGSPADIPPLPTDTVLPDPVNKTTSKHRHQDSSQTGTASIDSARQQISVVDAIAQTMVGEFLYKYVRKRFGQIHDTPQGGDGKEEGGSGVRHKRWVWLAPYERAVMWSTRQPTSGTALLGKSGRKLSIQSVLDVKDDAVPPRGVSLFSRSILILTPARALKFTAANEERHYVWLMALSFLAHSSQSVDNALTLPPALPFEVEQLALQPQPKFVQNNNKGKEKSLTSSIASQSVANGHDSSERSFFQNPFATNASSTTQQSYTLSNPEESVTSGQRNGFSRYGSLLSDSSFADFPVIARHSRKRSNTYQPRMVPTRNYTAPISNGSSSHRAANSVNSLDHGTSMHIYTPRDSVSYGRADSPGVGTNFFDALPPENIGTMRMEAFIDMTAQRAYGIDESPFDARRTLQSRSNNRNSRLYSREKKSLDFFGISDENTTSRRFGDEDDFIFHRRDSLFSGFSEAM